MMTKSFSFLLFFFLQKDWIVYTRMTCALVRMSSEISLIITVLNKMFVIIKRSTVIFELRDTITTPNRLSINIEEELK